MAAYSETRQQSRVTARQAPGTFTRALVHVHGSVFIVISTYKFWLQLIFLYFLALLVTLYTAVIEPPTFSITTADNWWDHLQAVSVLFNFIAVVTLSIFNVVVIHRWWEMRKALATVHDGMLSVARISASFMPTLESVDTRRILVRYSHAIHELLWRGTPAGDDTEVADSDGLVALGLLNSVEWGTIRRDPYPHVILLHWMTTVVLRARAQGLFTTCPDVAVEQFMAAFNDLRIGSQAVDMHVNTRDAYPLTQLVSVLSFVALIMFALEMGQDAGSEQLQGHSVWIAFNATVMFILHLLYNGLLELSHLLSNPFGTSKAQFPRTAFREQLMQTTRSLIKMGAIIPNE